MVWIRIWNGDNYLNIANIIRFAPSACNTQPWIVDSNYNFIGRKNEKI